MQVEILGVAGDAFQRVDGAEADFHLGMAQLLDGFDVGVAGHPMAVVVQGLGLLPQPFGIVISAQAI